MFQEKDKIKTVSISIPWDNFTARGFLASVVLLILFLLIHPFIKIAPPTPIREIKTIPIEILNFGSGDGTGRKGGNLTEEGQAQKGISPSINIEDAISSPKDAKKANNSSNIEESSNLKAVDNLKTKNNNQNNNTGSGNKTVGSPNGSSDGTGLALKGGGRGAGDGFGDISWGGGGNRTVVSKQLPNFPKGVNTSAKIVLQFKVKPDGTVSSVIAKQKADPLLEQAGINALKKWRFSRLNDNSPDMIGTIPLTFVLR